jgi:hypothetical protein
MTTAPSKLAIVPFVSVDNMMKLVRTIGVDTFLTELAATSKRISNAGKASTRPRA